MNSNNTSRATAFAIYLTTRELRLHQAKGSLHVEVRADDMLQEILSTPLGHMVAVLSVAIEDSIAMQIASLIDVLDDEKVVLIGPVGVAGLESLNSRCCYCVMALCVSRLGLMTRE